LSIYQDFSDQLLTADIADNCYWYRNWKQQSCSSRKINFF